MGGPAAAVDWDAVRQRALEVLLRLEAKGSLDERFLFRGTALWPFVRDGFFERSGGVLDWAIAEQKGGRALPRTSGGMRPLPRVETMVDTVARMVPRRLEPAPTLVVTPHRRWSDPWVSELGPAVTISISSGAGQNRNGSALEPRDAPWQSGLRANDLPAVLRARWRYRSRLAEILTEPGFRRELPASADGLRATFVGLANGLALAEALLLSASRLIAAVQPATIVSFDALGNAGRAFAAEGAKAGAKVIGVQTGVISPSGLTNLGYRLDLAGPRAPRPSVILVWGPFYREILAGFGWPSGSVDVGGLPTTESPRRDKGASIVYLASANEVICRAMADPDDELEVVAGLLSACGSDLTVRLHPNHAGTAHGRRLVQLVQAMGGQVEPPSRPLHETLGGASAVLGGGSTAVVESLRAGVPTGVVAMSGLEITGFAELGLPSLTAGGDAQAVISEIKSLPKSLLQSVADRVAPPPTGRLAGLLRAGAVVG